MSYGKEYIGGDIGLNYSPKGFTDPVWKWTPSIAPSGMAFYYGNMFPELRGKLLIGSLKFMRLFVVSMGKNGYPTSETNILKNVVGRVRDVEVLKDGSILILNDEQDGGLFRISRVKVNQSTECLLLYLIPGWVHVKVYKRTPLKHEKANARYLSKMKKKNIRGNTRTNRRFSFWRCYDRTNYE